MFFRKRNQINQQASSLSPKPKKRPRAWKIILFTVILGFLGVTLWVGISGWKAIKRITADSRGSSLLRFIWHPQPSQLSGEGDGRINVLLIGVGGAGHPGGTLADTIIVLSIDPKNKKVAFLSIPRDLYVHIAGNGYGKINSAHSFGESKPRITGGGAAVLKKTVSEVLDLPIHYYIRGDFIGFKKIVDELGGVTINVPNSFYDPTYPDDKMIGYAPFRVKKGVQTMNGATALKYARSRHGGNGEGSDFARSKRQQQLLLAIKDKALSLKILTNPKKVVDLMNILGDHVRTDMNIGEIERLMQLSQEVDTGNARQVILDNGPNGTLVSANCGGYCLKPKDGNFKEIQRIAHQIFSDPYITSERAVIEVRNATSQANLVDDVIKLLTSYGYIANISSVAMAPTAETVLYDYTNGKKEFTIKFLMDRFQANLFTKTRPSGVKSDLVLIIGTDYLTYHR